MNSIRRKSYRFLFNYLTGLVASLLFSTANPVLAQDTLSLHSTSKAYTLNPYLKVFHTQDSLSGEAAWAAIRDGSMEMSVETTNPGMAHPEDNYWLVFTLHHPDSLQNNYYIEIDYPQIDQIRFYEVGEDRVSELYTTGDQFVFDQRPVKSRNFILPFHLKGEPVTYLLNIDKQRSAVRFPIQVYHENVYLTRQFHDTLFYSFYFGFILLISIASLLLGLLVKKRVFIAYSLYLGAFWLWLFSRLGYTYQFLTFAHPELNRHFLPVCTQLTIMTLIFYVQAFFDTKTYLKKFHRVMNGVLIFFAAGYLAWAAFPDEFIALAPRLFAIRYTLTTLVIVFAITAAIQYRSIDTLRSNMFLLAYAIFFGAILSKILAEFGIVNESVFPADPILLGFFVEVLVLTITMGLILKKMLDQRKKLAAENEELLTAIEIHTLKEKIKSSGFITLKSKAVVPLDQLMYIRADDHYLEFYFDGDQHKEIDRNTLSQISSELPDQFARIHRSTIVNLQYIKATYSDRLLLKDGTTLPLSRKYKQELMDVFMH